MIILSKTFYTVFQKYLLLFFILITNISYAQKVSRDEILTLARNFLKPYDKPDIISQTPNILEIFSEKTNDLLFYVLNYPEAYLVISADKSFTPLKAFSFNSKLNTVKNTNELQMIDILKSDYEDLKKYLSKNPEIAFENQQKWNSLLANNTSFKTTKDQTYGPYLESIYGQTWYYENGNPVYTTNYFTPNHNPVGCVALTFTEIMQYYKWPRIGIGSHSYTDNYGSTTGTFQANFEEAYYNWSLVLDKYKGIATTDNQRSQLGKISFHAAVSVNMEFESSGSTSNINKIPNAANSHFRYVADYKEKEASDFWQVLDSNLHKGIPAQFSIYTSGGAGHAIVGDGIQYIGSEKYYHLNMGWWGDDNGWYQIHQSFNAGGYTIIDAAVLNMVPVPELDDTPVFNYEDKTVEMKWYYTEKIVPENYEMQVKTGTADWQSYTDTITLKSFLFQADDENEYSIRIRAKVNNEWKDNSWSNTISFGPDDFVKKGDEELTLYPTVASDNLKVSYAGLPGSKIQIFDLLGKLIYETHEEILSEEYNINVSTFETGIYILQTVNETEKKASRFLKL